MTIAPDHPTPPPIRLGPRELAVLHVMLESVGRVVSRHELARRTGLTDRSERRCDALIVTLRRALGPGAIRNVRSRGWILSAEAVERAKVLGGS